MPLAYQVDASTGILGPVLPSINNPGDFQISPDLHTLYYGDIDRSPAALKSFDVSTATPTLLRQSAFNAIGENGQAVVLSHNGSILTSVCGYPYGMSNYGVVLRNSGDFSTLVPLVTGAYPENLSFSPDDLRAYVAHGAGSSNGVDIFDTSTGTLLNQFPVANFVTNMLVAPNSRQLFVTFDTGPYGNTHTYVYDTGVVPEPASITLLAIGATTLLGRRRR
ncbi:MAG: PEP-CTERM sorting domain-containing protein [Phycisphaerae bacterium]